MPEQVAGAQISRVHGNTPGSTPAPSPQSPVSACRQKGRSEVRQTLGHKAVSYTAFKYRPGGGFARLGIKMADFIPYMRDRRKAVGPNFDLIQEANTRWSMEQCMEIAPMLEQLKTPGRRRQFPDNQMACLLAIQVNDDRRAMST